MSSIVNCLTTRALIAGGTLLVLGCWQACSAEPPAMAPAAAKDTFYFVPHTHWEGAVFKTREAYLDMGLPNILRALQLRPFEIKTIKLELRSLAEGAR